MAAKLYRSANGKNVDMGKLLMKNENVMAVGNMNVNARGDLLNTKTQKSIQTRAETVTKHYAKQVQSNVSDDPIYSVAPDKTAEPIVKKTAAVEKPKAVKKEEKVDLTNFDDEVFSDIPLAEEEIEQTDEPKSADQDVDINDLDDIESDLAKAEEPQQETGGGLAAAIARAKEVKQEPLPKPGTPTKVKRV